MNLANFRTYVGYDFKRTDKTTELTQAYNDAIIAVAVKMPHGVYKYTSYVPTVDGQPDYPLPATIMYLIHPIKLLEGTGSSDSGWQLEHITKEEYDELEPNPFRTSPDSKADPAKYTIFSGVILPWPIPDDATHLLEIDWTKIPTDQSGVTDTPALPDYWREVLKQMTLSRVFQGLGLYQEAQYWRAMYEDGAGNPIGLYADFLNIEKDKEGRMIGQVKANSL